MTDEHLPTTSTATPLVTEQILSKLIIDDIFFQNRILDDNIVRSTLSRHGFMLKNLIVKCCNDQICEVLIKMGQYCPNVEDVDLHLIGTEQIACLKSLAPGCPKINTVVLYIRPNRRTANYEIYYDSYIEACSEGLLAIAQNCKDLKCMSITNLPNIRVKWLEVINPNLLTLNLFDSEFTPEAMRRLMQRCNSLQEFSLDSWIMLYEGMVLDFLTQYRTTLKVFRKKYRDYFDDEWQLGLPRLNNLEVLQMSSNALDDDFIMVLVKNCPGLQCLDIGHSLVTDFGLMELQSLPHLKHLAIGEHSRIRGHGLELLVAKGVLQEVTIGPSNCDLHEVCRHLAAKFPTVRFVLQEDARCLRLTDGRFEEKKETDENSDENSAGASDAESEMDDPVDKI